MSSMLALFAGATTHHTPAGPLPGVEGQDSVPQDTPPPSPASPSRPCHGHHASTPSGEEPLPTHRLDDAVTPAAEVTHASGHPPPFTLHAGEQPQDVVGGEGGAPTPTHRPTLPTHSAYSAAFHPLTPPVPPTTAPEPHSPAPSTPPQHHLTPTPPPKAARIQKESVVSSHDVYSSPQSPPCPASPLVQVYSLRGEQYSRGVQEDPVTRPPRRKEEEEEEVQRTRRVAPAATTTTTTTTTTITTTITTTPGERREREAPPEVMAEVRSPIKPATDPVPDPCRRTPRGSTEECSRGPPKPCRGRPAGESQAPRVVQVEVVDEEARRSGPRRREERRGGGGGGGGSSGLLEWEARQRQRLEEEERNRLNIGLSLRPVSCRIKELVKMHGAFMSRFSRDKKTDINGTVDGTDDILFQKIPQDPSTRPQVPQVPQVSQVSTTPMRSPFMVKKILTPTHDPNPRIEPPRPTRRDHPRRRSPARRSSPATRRTSPATRRTSPTTRRTSPSTHRTTSSTRRTSPAPQRSPSTRRTSPSTRRTSPAPRRTSPSLRRTSPAPRRRSPSLRRSSPASQRRSPSTQRRSPSTHRSGSISRRSPSGHRGSVEGRRAAPSHGVLSESNGQPSPTRDATDSLCHTLSSSMSPATRRRNTTSSPDRKGCTPRGKDGLSKTSEVLAELRRPAQSPLKPHDLQGSVGSNSKSADSTWSSVIARSPDGARQPSSPGSLSPERQDGAARGSIKDPKARKEWLTKMLTSLTPEPLTPGLTSPILLSPTPISHSTASPNPASSTHTSRSSVCFTPVSPTHDPPSRRQADTPHSPSRTAPTSHAPVGPLRSLGTGPRGTLEEDVPVVPVRKSALASLKPQSDATSSSPITPSRGPLEEDVPVVPVRRSALASLKPQSDATPSSPITPSKTFSSSTTVTLHTPTASPLLTHHIPHHTHTHTFTSAPPPAVPPTTPSEDSLRGPTKESSSQEASQHCRRGPVSLSSILSDSSRSSSRCSSPLTSPRPSPERILKRDSFDLAARLGVIEESGGRGERRGWGAERDQKENIAPLPKDNTSGEDTPSLSAPFRSSFRLRERSEERRKGGRKWSEEGSSRGSGLSWRPALTAPSITLRALADTPLRKQSDATWPPARTEAPAKGLSTGDAHGLSRNSRERASLRSPALRTKSSSRKLSPSPECGNNLQDKPSEHGEGPVSLSTILSREDGGMSSHGEGSTTYKFSPKLSFSEELTHLSHRYRQDVDASHSPKEATPPTAAPPSAPVEGEAAANRPKTKQRPKQPSPAKTTTGQRRTKEGSPAPNTAPKPSATASNTKNKVVRRNSSLKRNRPEDSRASLRAKKERRNSEEDAAHETVVEGAEGTTHTRTTVKRTRLPASDKARPVARSGSGRCRRERSFRSNASRALEDWAASTSVKGHLVKKEGQRFSHETEEEERAGRRVARSVARRVVRRGSRTLSGGGELLTETKETSSSGVAKDGQKATKKEGTKENESRTVRKENEEKKENGEDGGGTLVEASKEENGLSRKMKTSTDGERYFTHSVTDKDGAKTFTTEGVNNKTTSSVEVIGAKDFDARRAVKGTTGERVVVERTKDPLGRPSTVVKKVTSQSRLVITKTKRKTPVVV